MHRLKQRSTNMHNDCHVIYTVHVYKSTDDFYTGFLKAYKPVSKLETYMSSEVPFSIWPKLCHHSDLILSIISFQDNNLKKVFNQISDLEEELWHAENSTDQLQTNVTLPSIDSK